MTSFLLPEAAWPERLEPALRERLRALLAGLRAEPGVLGVAAGGSFVSGRLDAFSDLDLVVVGDPALLPGTPDRRRALAASLGPLLAAFTGEHVGEPRLLICLYGPPLVHVDLKFVSTDALAHRVEDPTVLFDRDGALRAALVRGVARYPAPDHQWIEDRFWVWVHYVSAKLGRGELFDALESLGYLRVRVLGPLALEEATVQPNGLRRIESDAPERARALEATVARYDAADCLRALRAEIALYRSLRERRALPGLRRSAEAETAAEEYLSTVARRLHVSSSRDE